MPKRRRKLDPLLPVRSDEPDLFICDVLDATPKGDRASMEHPLFSLSIKKDMQSFSYDNGKAQLRISPSHDHGRANIFDRDILIYILSQLMTAKNEGRTPSRRVRLCAHDLLRSTNRHTTGPAYGTLKAALTRLQFTKIETNIHDHGIAAWRQISFITDAKIVKEDASGRMLDMEVEIGQWLLDAVENNNVLTLSRDYFRLRKPLERRLYELARKHCGRQKEWSIGLDNLQEKCGSKSSEKEFKRLVKAICRADEENGHMPDYRFRVVGGILTVSPKPTFESAMKGDAPQLALVPPLPASAYEKAKAAAPGYDVYALEDEWRGWITENPRNAEAAFVGFCKKVFDKRGPTR